MHGFRVLVWAILLLLSSRRQGVVRAMLGVDLTVAYTTSDWAAFLASNPNVKFVISRLMDDFGHIDYVGMSTLAAAYKSGIKDLSGYIYPCIQTSTYAVYKNVTCQSPAKQIKMLVQSMKTFGISFQNYSTTSFYPTGQPSSQPSRQPTSRPSIPTGQPSRSPTSQPSRRPSSRPTSKPTRGSRKSTSAPTLFKMPKGQPTRSATRQPSGVPTTKPSQHKPTLAPSPVPTQMPGTPTANPTVKPSPQPTQRPSPRPSLNPSQRPTPRPTTLPTRTSSAPTFINGTRNQLLPIKRIFLMVEDDSPNRYFSVNNKVNQQYLTQLAYAAWQQGFELGIYTTLFCWNNIMTLPEGVAGDRFMSNLNRKHLPLWMPRFDSKPGDMSFFVPFGGWKQVFMKQYKGGSSGARRAGSTRINLNYANDTSIFLSPTKVIIDPVGSYSI